MFLQYSLSGMHVLYWGCEYSSLKRNYIYLTSTKMLLASRGFHKRSLLCRAVCFFYCLYIPMLTF